MPAGCTALTKVAANPPHGGSFNEQASDASPGNKFAAQADKTRLFVRNTTETAIELNVYADKYGEEVLLQSTSIPGSGTENGERILGPWPAEFLEHSTTEVASNGQVMVAHAGSDGDLMLCPFD